MGKHTVLHKDVRRRPQKTELARSVGRSKAPSSTWEHWETRKGPKTQRGDLSHTVILDNTVRSQWGRRDKTIERDRKDRTWDKLKVESRAIYPQIRWISMKTNCLSATHLFLPFSCTYIQSSRVSTLPTSAQIKVSHAILQDQKWRPNLPHSKKL
jgi:hypothetical protein